MKQLKRPVLKLPARPWWPLGIRLQLTLWFTCVFAILLFGASAFLYQHLQTSLARSLDSTLQSRAEQIAGEIYLQDNHIQMHESVGDLPGFDQQANNNTAPPHSVNDNILVSIFDQDGKPYRSTPAFRTLNVPANSVAQTLKGDPWEDTVKSRDGTQDARIYSRTIIKNGHLVGVVQVGQFLDELQLMLRHVANELLVMGVVVLLFSALGSYWLASRAFAPIHNLIRTARSIKEGDLHQRVPVPKARDEVYFLAVTLNEMIESLEAVFSRQRRFVADASHELRTPVAVIRSTTDVALLHASTQEEYIGVLRNVNLESERLGRLINDLLALARGDEGQTKLELEPVRLDQLADVVAANADMLAEERHITIYRDQLQPTMIMGDETRLIQMVMNLLDNAIAYTNAGGCIRLSVINNSKQAILTVQDTGIGIDAEHLPHIFERFYRADQARIRDGGGSSGLGLAIVEWTVNAHQGSISVDSQPGKGSTFTITLPTTPDIQPKERLTAAAKSGSSTSSPRHIW
ncbi:two-component sensor histidine kinase [Dictyobacter vulcani]|uniref:histidine kinase n=1 Tax=Dictyobacter vulcani TaxID=2607529 RepID=A0A5J4KPM1_9CHLR|nr:HAMP domain-containing sensor histidine kinase [Dictyobacter vulcani]GER88069.1 two-component sensor histidine kinase [Dictyobacter vulcani]